MELEAAHYFHYPGLSAWRRESPHFRAMAIAHYCEHNTRESYAYEKSKAAADKTGATHDAGAPHMEVPTWSKFRQGRGRE